MRRSRLVVSALGFAFLLGTVISLAANPPEKSAGNKKPEPEKKVMKAAAPPVLRTGEEAIEAALARPVTCEFVETPLKDVIDYLQDKVQVEIYLDSSALKDAGVDESTPVTCRHQSLRFEKVLGLVLNELKLTWTIHNDVLYVTTPEKAESDEFLPIRLYDVADLVVYQDQDGKKFDDFAPLTNVIINTIDTKTWAENGGTGSIFGESFGTAKILVVSHRYDVHKKVAALLTEIRTIAAKKSSGDGLPRRERPKAAKTAALAQDEPKTSSVTPDHMNRDRKWKVEESAIPDDLAKAVEKDMADGWEPCGGISVTAATTGGTYYYQAMWKR
ncbi:MAG: hypothetical protein ABSG53_20660 [Thermoguttaceae bacterium]|jgi:hypothetical protein